MNRKVWLETFLRLADSNAPVVGYRKELRLMSNQLPAHIAKISHYRKELASIIQDEKTLEDTKRQALDEKVKTRNVKKISTTINVDMAVSDIEVPGPLLDEF